MVPTEELEGYPRRSRAPTLVLAGVAAIALVWMLSRPAAQRPMPSFELDRLSGSGTLSSEELRGSPIVLNFFASWCAPCREEAPVLERAWREYRQDGVRFVGVNFQDTRPRARQFVEEFGLTFPIVVDDGKLARDLNVYGLPQTFFVDDDFQLVARNDGEKVGERSGTATFGAIDERELRERIDALLKTSEDGTALPRSPAVPAD